MGEQVEIDFFRLSSVDANPGWRETRSVSSLLAKARTLHSPRTEPSAPAFFWITRHFFLLLSVFPLCLAVSPHSLPPSLLSVFFLSFLLVLFCFCPADARAVSSVSFLRGVSLLAKCSFFRLFSVCCWSMWRCLQVFSCSWARPTKA